MIASYGGLLAFLLWDVLTTKASPADPGAVSFIGAWSLVASLFGFIPMAAVGGGIVFGAVPRPVVEIVFPAPLNRSTLGQELVRRGLIRMGVVISATSALAGFVLSRLYAIPAWLGALRIGFIVLPIVGLWWLGGHFASYVAVRYGKGLQTAIVSVFCFSIGLGLPLLTLSVLLAPDSPAATILMAPALPFTELLLGLPLGTPEVLVIGLTWAAFVFLAFLALRWAYEMHGGDGVGVARAADGLSIERAPTAGILRQIAVRLRFRYLDLGSGVRALLGRNLSLSMRSQYAVFNVMTTSLVAVLGVVFLTSHGGRVSIGPLVIGMIVAMIAPFGSPSPAMDVGQLDLIRLLPLRARDVFLGYVTLPMTSAAVWSAVIGVVALATGAPFALALLLFSAFGSMGLATATLGFFAGTLPIPASLRSSATESGVTISPWLFPSVFIVVIEINPMVFTWGTPSAYPLLGFLVPVNMLLFALLSIAGIARFGRPR